MQNKYLFYPVPHTFVRYVFKNLKCIINASKFGKHITECYTKNTIHWELVAGYIPMNPFTQTKKTQFRNSRDDSYQGPFIWLKKLVTSVTIISQLWRKNRISHTYLVTFTLIEMRDHKQDQIFEIQRGHWILEMERKK